MVSSQRSDSELISLIEEGKKIGINEVIKRKKNVLDKAFFQHDMAYGDFKDLARRTDSDKILREKAFNVAKNSKYHGC